MDLRLEGRLALVSGSTAGIGRAIAAALAKEGARVIVNGRTQPAVEQAVAELRSTTGGNVIGFAADLADAAAAEALQRAHPGVEKFSSTISASVNPSRSRRSRTPTGCASSRSMC